MHKIEKDYVKYQKRELARKKYKITKLDIENMITACNYRLIKEGRPAYRDNDINYFIPDLDISTEIEEEFNFFVDVIHNIDSFDLDNFYKRIHSVEIKENKNMFLYNLFTFESSPVVAYYDSSVNEIGLDKKTKREDFTHELLHLATSNDNSVGFDMGIIGVGINEGYTELFNKRYFGKKVSADYYFAMRMSLEIEKIIGRDEMIYCYSRGDLYSLVLLLNEYYSIKDIINFLKSLDKTIVDDNKYYKIKCAAFINKKKKISVKEKRKQYNINVKELT